MPRRSPRRPHRSYLLSLGVAALAIAAARSPVLAQGEVPADAPYLNPTLPVDQRVNDLVSRMTLEEKVSQLVNAAAAIPRLKVPAYNWWSEAAHGVAAAGYATDFPQVIGLGATWDTPLVHRIGEVISTEGRAKYQEAVREKQQDVWFYGLTFWAPNINIFRDPRWGRGQETYGEDPFLTSRLGVAMVRRYFGSSPCIPVTNATPMRPVRNGSSP